MVNALLLIAARATDQTPVRGTVRLWLRNVASDGSAEYDALSPFGPAPPRESRSQARMGRSIQRDHAGDSHDQSGGGTEYREQYAGVKLTNHPLPGNDSQLDSRGQPLAISDPVTVSETPLEDGVERHHALWSADARRAAVFRSFAGTRKSRGPSSF
jgi:hypothetical protein